jgi:fatty-acyl-CoA synthase
VAESLIDRVLGRGQTEPDRELLVERDRRVSAGEFTRLVERLAAGLHRAGVRPGDRVAIVPTIGIDTIAVRYAALRLGCMTAFCPNTGVAGRLAGFVARMDADALIVFPQTAAAAGEAECRLRLSVGPADGATALHPSASDAPSADGAAAGVLVTSGGTTGDPKTSRRDLAAWTRVTDIGPLRDRRLLVCTSLAYVAQVLADQVLIGGGTVVLCERFDPSLVLAAIEAERVTHVGLVEPLLVALADHPDVARRDLSSLRAISHVGADAAPSLRLRLLGRMGEILVNPYGASEVGIVSALAAPDYSAEHPELLATVGRPLPGVDVRIETDVATPAGAGELGAISVASGQVADGYASPVPGSRFRDGRFHTGDLGLIDPAGYLHVRGREADRRVVAGRAVMPVDLQEILCRHPEVRYAVAVPEPAPRAGFGAVVTLAPDSDVTPEQLTAFARDRGGEPVVPARLAVLDRMPVTEQGKPDRAAIVRLLDAGGA